MAVVDAEVVDPEPPHPTTVQAGRIASTKASCAYHRPLFFRRRAHAKPRNPPPHKNASAVACPRPGIDGLWRRAEAALVWRVNVDVAAAEPDGVTVAGLKLQAVCVGKPLQANVTCWLNPPDGVIDTVEVAEAPAVAVPLNGLN